MDLRVFTVYDSKAEAYLQPFYCVTKGQAIRAFADACNGGNQAFTTHPEDYTLFELGTWSDSNAKFVAQDAPIPLGVAIEYKKANPAFSDTLENDSIE